MEAERINLLNNTLADLEKRSGEIRVYLDYDGKKDRLEEVVGLSEDPELWNDPKRAQEIGKERKVLEGIVLTLDNIASGIDDNRLLIDMALEEGDEDSFAAIEEDVAELEKQMAELEFKRMFNQPADVNNCFIDITAGAGGTEAEDWAGMLLRMYVRYGERKGFKVEINPADVRTDTFRASGAGGQHINKTDSAVRMTHIPTGIVVQSQNSRSQHDNRRVCEEMLRAKLFELGMRKRNEEKQALEEGKSDVGWGSQIRSYVLDSSRIKDLRTGHETGNTKAVLDGDLDDFIEASLKQGV